MKPKLYFILRHPSLISKKKNKKRKKSKKKEIGQKSNLESDVRNSAFNFK